MTPVMLLMMTTFESELAHELPQVGVIPIVVDLNLVIMSSHERHPDQKRLLRFRSGRYRCRLPRNSNLRVRPTKRTKSDQLTLRKLRGRHSALRLRSRCRTQSRSNCTSLWPYWKIPLMNF